MRSRVSYNGGISYRLVNFYSSSVCIQGSIPRLVSWRKIFIPQVATARDVEYLIHFPV
ncbi:MAG TPA: hypothetical protein VFW07_13505 [Parafilimonas sp.]|nr:hypothetical protein [Parafilimonas sp.]